MPSAIQLDIGHYVLLAVILVMVIKNLISEHQHIKERSDMSNKLMARSLTEYTASSLDLNRKELSEEEERDILDKAMKEDRVQV